MDLIPRKAGSGARWIGLAIGMLGLALRLRQAMGGRSIWIDEGALAMNLLERPFSRLLEPLEHQQAAPAGFLALEWLSLAWLGRTEAALRWVSLAGALGSMLLLARLARRVLGEAFALIPIALFAGLEVFLYFAWEGKPYSTDLLLALLWTELGFAPAGLALGLAGAACLWFSFPLLFVLAAVGVVHCAEAPRGRVLLMCGLWLAAAIPFALISARGSPSTPYLREFWSEAFWPLPPRSLKDWLWPITTYFRFFTILLGLPAPAAAVAVVFCPAGLASLSRRAPRAALLLGLPFAFALAASALRVYPCFGRPALFLTPSLLLLVAEGLAWAWRRYRSRALHFGLCAALLAPCAPDAARRLLHPIRWEELRPVLEGVAARMRPTDTLYVYSQSLPAFRFYEPRHRFQQVRLWPDARENPAESLAGFERLCGLGRVWLILSHSFEEDEALAELFLVRRAKVLDKLEAPGALALLLDFDQPPPRRQAPTFP